MSESEINIIQGTLYNVALFIDYENVYKNLLDNNHNTIRDGFFEKFRKISRLNLHCKKKRL